MFAVTKGQVFSPPVAVVHRDKVSLFEAGEAAPDYIAALAEEGEQLFLEQEADIIELFRKKVVELYIREVEHAKLRTTRLRRAYSLGARLL